MSAKQAYNIVFKSKLVCETCHSKSRYYIYDCDKYYECKIKSCECENVFITIHRSYDIRDFTGKLPTKVSNTLETRIDNSEGEEDNRATSESETEQKNTKSEQKSETDENDYNPDTSEAIVYSEYMEE
jgi:hypothetical protein